MDMPRTMPEATFRILEERRRQDEKWGEQNHDFFVWLAILQEEIGEASEAALEVKFRGSQAPFGRINARLAFLNELIQVAAVAQAMVECELRRDKEAQG